jgi:aldehyde:ferredoxin oxidoreductase
MKQQGTSSAVDFGNEFEALPTRYFSEHSFEDADKINGDVFESKKFKRGTCSNCAFACKLPTKDRDAGIETEGPEYENIMAFGTNAAVDDIANIMQSNQLCDELGMDTLSCYNSLYEGPKGLLECGVAK